MKQKYLILNSDDQKELIIREFTEVDDKEALLLLTEEKYDIEVVNSAIKKGKTALIYALRTENLYPPDLYVDKIAESVILMSGEQKQSVELLFDDVDLINNKDK